MGHLPLIISDLALILIVASITTLIFKILKQPVVLGYIVAGMIVGPVMSMLPSVQDTSNVQIWADIGVLFLLFALGLEFSFKKLIAVGKTGIITACVEVFSLLVLGYLVGMLMGWGSMNSLFLGAMLSMSSTTIIIKAFEDLNIKRKRFTGLVFGVLVVEDLLAIVMMVLLSTIAVSAEFSGWDMLTSVFKLIFFLALWFIAGVYLIPSLLQKTRKHLNDETLLVVSVGLCLSMVVLAVKVGFSSALGAFIMGSILAETIEAERIEKLIKPLKDLFGAVFFVSVGMMVDIKVLAEYVWPIVILVLVVLVLKMIASTAGMLLSGQALKVSVQSGFSLAQIGEFAFIIASLGMSLNATSDFLYPVAVAVSVVTTFMTPYMIKLSTPVYLFLEKHLPVSMKAWLKKREPASGNKATKMQNDWIQLLRQYTTNLLLMLILNLGIIMLSLRFLEPFLSDRFTEGLWAGIICSVITLAVMSPFLKSMISNRRKTSGHMMNLWTMNAYNRFIILAMTSLRLVLACVLVVYVLMYCLDLSGWIVIPIAIVLIVIILKSKALMRHYWQLESAFVINLNERQMHENHERIRENQGVRQVDDMGDASWLDRILYAYSMEVGENSYLVDKSLEEVNFRALHNLIVIRAQRGDTIVNIPGRDYVIQAGDILTFAGKNKTMLLLNESVWDFTFVQDSLRTLHHFSQMEMASETSQKNHLCCAGFPVSEKSPVANKTLREAQIGRNQKCLVLGLERKDKRHINPSSDFQIQSGDIVWVLGEENFVSRLISSNVYGL